MATPNVNSFIPLIVKCPRCKGGDCTRCDGSGQVEFGICAKCESIKHIYPTPNKKTFEYHALCKDCMEIQKELLGIARCDHCKEESELYVWDHKKKGYKHLDLLCKSCYDYYYEVLHQEGRLIK